MRPSNRDKVRVTYDAIISAGAVIEESNRSCKRHTVSGSTPTSLFSMLIMTYDIRGAFELARAHETNH